MSYIEKKISKGLTSSGRSDWRVRLR
jgi:hypothetical protein